MAPQTQFNFIQHGGLFSQQSWIQKKPLEQILAIREANTKDCSYSCLFFIIGFKSAVIKGDS